MNISIIATKFDHTFDISSEDNSHNGVTMVTLRVDDGGDIILTPSEAKFLASQILKAANYAAMT